jgi:hypothetical protein
MEPIIALLVTVALACLLGFWKSGEKTLNDTDTKALGAAYREYLRAVSAAGLVKLSNFVGDSPAEEDIDESVNGPRLIADMVAVLDGEKSNTVIKGVHVDESPTVKSFLASIADDAEKYWPDQISIIRQVREPQL